jgi:hypothetical protein
VSFCAVRRKVQPFSVRVSIDALASVVERTSGGASGSGA